MDIDDSVAIVGGGVRVGGSGRGYKGNKQKWKKYN